MALELESILMAESRKPIRMALLRPPWKNEQQRL
jgi:hypothetical protein